MKGLPLVAALASALGCIGTADVGPGGREGDPDIEFLSPEIGASAVRDQLALLGARVANLDARLQVSGLATVEVWAGGLLAGAGTVVGTTMDIELAVETSGAVTLEARGLDDAGEIIASSELDIQIDDPDFDCSEWLDFYDVDHQLGPAEPGIAEPVTVSMPIVGLPYRSGGALRDSMLGDCDLIVALAEAAPILRRRDIVEVTDLGVYNYRCIGGGAPPDCPGGISQHAYATAIDIAGYTTSDGSFYSVNDDWVIDPDGEATCGTPVTGPRNTFLHEAICTQKAANIWNIVLTPNYNADHRNHFHIDLTPDSDFIR